jgi:hypothetical protein
VKTLGLLVAVGGLIGLSVIDLGLGFLVGPEHYNSRIGLWGFVCALCFVVSVFAFYVGEKHGRVFKGAGIGLLAPFLPLFLGRGMQTVVLLFVPIALGVGLLWKGVRPTSEYGRG